MNFRLTAILSGLALFLGLLILLWDRDNDTAQERLERARRAFRFNPERVDGLRIESDDLTLECRLRNGHWFLVHPITSRADPVAIERLLGALQELPRGNIILPSRRKDEAYAPYGLQHPRSTISIIEGTATNRILIGRGTPLGDGVYIRQSDHAGIARLDLSLLQLLPGSPDALRDRSLLSGAAADIERLDIRSPAGFIQLARNGDGEWRLFQPFTARADTAAVSKLIDGLMACSVSEFIQDGVSDLAPYGLNSQNAVTVVLNTDSGNSSQMLAFGDPLPNDPGRVYARLQAENSIYAVPLEVRESLLVNPDDLRDRHIPGTDPDNIRSVRIEEAETLLAFSLDDENGWQLTAPIQAPADPAAIRQLLDRWSKVRLSRFEPPVTTSAPPPFIRTIQITPRRTDQPITLLALGHCRTNQEASRIQIDGESAVGIAGPADLLTCPLDPTLYHTHDLISVPEEDILSIRIETPNQAVELSRSPDTGIWTPDVPWLGDLLLALSPLRAETILSQAEARQVPESRWKNPDLTLTAQRSGKSGLGFTLMAAGGESDNDPVLARIRGRDLVFTLSPLTLEALTPPSETE